jgi:glycosyltransferase involved in cell wall biosynthesis
MNQNPNHSTTRQVRQVSASVVEAEIKAAHKPEDKFETVLFLPEGEGRKGEGGLRTQGYFKQSQEGKPLITVVTVVFNGEKLLEETILSVINQTYDNVEYIIIDGGSTDGTVDIIRKYENFLAYWVSEPDKGIYDAWNKGISFARGDWIAFLGADDIYFANALADYVEAIKSVDCNYISSRINLVSTSKAFIRTVGEKLDKSRLSKKMMNAHVGSLHASKLFQRCGGFSLEYKIVADYEFFLRNSNTIRPAFISTITASMRVGGVSNVNLLALFEAERLKSYYSKHGFIVNKCIKWYRVLKWYLRRLVWY